MTPPAGRLQAPRSSWCWSRSRSRSARWVASPRRPTSSRAPSPSPNRRRRPRPNAGTRGGRQDGALNASESLVLAEGPMELRRFRFGLGRRDGGGGAGAAALLQRLDHRRQDRQQHDDGDDRQQVLVDVLADGFAQDVARQRDAHAPDEPPDDVVGGERAAVHLTHAGEHGRERAHDRNEARQENRLRAVLLEELLGPFDVLLFEDPRVGTAKQRGSRALTDRVSDLITDYC